MSKRISKGTFSIDNVILFGHHINCWPKKSRYSACILIQLWQLVQLKNDTHRSSSHICYDIELFFWRSLSTLTPTPWDKMATYHFAGNIFKCLSMTEKLCHYNEVIMGTMASQITSLTIVYSTVYSGADQRKHQSFASLAFVRGIHRRPVNSPHKWPVTRKMFPYDDVIMVFRFKLHRSVCLRL